MSTYPSLHHRNEWFVVLFDWHPHPLHLQVPILFNLSDSQLLELAQQLKQKTVEPGEVVIKEGDEGDSFYIIEEGTFSCYLNDGTKLALIDRGSCFGELALLHNDKRKCNVAAEKTGGVLPSTFTKWPCECILLPLTGS
jgi:CRP-like cAMP-binding protein